MANFNTHLTVGFVVSGVLAITAYKVGLIENNLLIVCTAIGTIGGILPDIDLKHTQPAKMTAKFFSIIIAFFIVMTWGREYSIAAMVLMWAIGFVTMRYGMFELYNKLTVHRGIVHSVPYMAVLALLLVHICAHFIGMNALYSWLLGLFLFLGSLVHLLLDEIYSVDIMNIKVKRSFGTAMKFFEFKKWYFYVATYTVLGVLVVFAPTPEPLWLKLSDSITWLILSKSILPSW